MPLALLSPTVKSPISQATLANEPKKVESVVLCTPVEDVQARAQARLKACPYREVQQATCLFNKGMLLLQGNVSSYYLKQIAQSVLMNVDGVRHIVNTIHVRSTDQTSTDEQS